MLTYFWGITEDDKADFEPEVKETEYEEPVAEERVKADDALKDGQTMEIVLPCRGRPWS